MKDSLPTINKVFSAARFIGLSQYGLNLYFLWTIIVFCCLIAIESVAIWKFVRLLTGIAVNTKGGRGLIGRLSGSIFYLNAVLSLVFSIKFIRSWEELSTFWLKVDSVSGLNLPHDVGVKRKITVVSIFITVCAVVEHMLSMLAAIGLDCPVEEIFHRYMLVSHGFLMQSYEYNQYVAIPLFVISKIATLLWNFQDLIIIVISMSLTSRYQKLNKYVNHVVKTENKTKEVEKLGTDVYIQMQIWRRVRESYVRQATLVRQVDSNLGPLILLSNINNLYFICLQLFAVIGRPNKEELVNSFYYVLSLSWMMFRASSVVLAASDVHRQSRNALYTLYKCPGSGYNIEVKRLINQLNNDPVALSGMGLFSLKRELMLQVAATILKYELVLLQYDVQ